MHLRDERARLDATPADMLEVRAEDALMRLTDGEGKRALAVGTFARIGVVAGVKRRSHRIVDVEATAEAERRGLTLALPTRLEVLLVGDTGFEPVTSRM